MGKEQRWSLLYHADRVSIEPVENGCRTYGCCGGRECGYTTEEAQAEIVKYYESQASFWRKMPADEFVASQGYAPLPAASPPLP